MTAWIPSLQAAAAATAYPLLPSTCLAAVALDDAGLAVEDVMGGVTIVTATSRSLREAVEAVVMTVLDPAPKWSAATDLDAVLIVENCKLQAGWRQAASDSGRAVIVIVGNLEDVHPSQAAATADRTVHLTGDYLPGSLEAAITLVTGEHIELNDWWPRVDFEDAVACIQRNSTPFDCARRLHRLVEAGREAERIEEEPVETAQPLGQAAAGVVRRLSEMTGFGDAGAWGIQCAADIRAYAAGQLAWSEVDRGILLSGPPGSGKTTFSKAFALEAQVELVATTYADWHAGSGGDSMSKGMVKLFEGWRKKASSKPFILFIDEIDTIGRRGGNGHNESWFTSCINSWLAFLDGAVSRAGIVVVAATNNADRVDPALMRPGRLDRVVDLPYPDAQAMVGIVRHHLGPDAVVDDEDLAKAARACRGMSPAQVEQVCREARRVARVTFRRRVCATDVEIVLGARRLERLQRPGQTEVDRRIAIHEAAHAVAMLASAGEVLVHVDIDEGATCARRRPLVTLAQVEAEMTMLLAGMAAEELLLDGHASTVQVDLVQATNLATSAHAAWGMGATLRAHAVEVALSDVRIEAAVEEILRAAHQRAIALVEGSREAVIRLADRLQVDRYLDAAEVRAVVDGPAPEPATTKVLDRVVGRRGRHPDPSP